MDKQTAIDILEEVKVLDDSIYQYSYAYMAALDMAIEALKGKTSWIPVQEQLPPKNIKVLVSHKKETKETVSRFVNVDYMFYPNDVEWGSGSNDIEAWMPFPMPYGLEEK